MPTVSPALLLSVIPQIFTCVTSPIQERKALHFLHILYLPVSLNPSVYQPTAAVIPSFLTSLCPFRCIWQHPSVSESWKQQGTDRRMDRQRLPRGFLTVSFCNSIPSNLLFPTHVLALSLWLSISSLRPNKSLSCLLTYLLTVAPAHYLTQFSLSAPFISPLLFY